MDKIIFFTILVLFPFGQLFKIGIFNLFDMTVFALAMINLLRKPIYPSWYRYIIYFILACVFSLLVNYKLVDIKSILYLVRLWSYSMIAVYISNFVSDHKAVDRSLLAVSVSAATLGWLQYIFWPDLTALRYLGWDDHLLRMAGTFLDPTYLGLILVLGIILAEKLNFKKIIYFLLISLAFTYSRSSYLIASLFLIYKKKFLPLIIFILIILLLPKNIGEGTNLTRTVSGNKKLINYKENAEIFIKSPLVGIGFNNMCNARQLYLNDTNVNSHSCSGSDSSILFLLATTGIIGSMLLLHAISHMPYDIILKASFIVVLLHSLFANSLFYPHIMFWMFALLGLRSKSNS